jgi:hypothetical protein
MAVKVDASGGIIKSYSGGQVPIPKTQAYCCMGLERALSRKLKRYFCQFKSGVEES